MGRCQNICFVVCLLLTVKAKEMLKEVHDAEMMVNMTREAADQAMMRAMDAAQQARNASSRMDQLIQVSRDVRTDGLLFRTKIF